MTSNTHVPDGWRLARLGDVADLRREQVKPRKNDLRPYVALEHIISEGALNGYRKAGESISNKTLFRRGDTLFGKLRPNLRKVIRVEFDGVCSTDILAIFGCEQVDGFFLSHLLRGDSAYEYAMRGVGGTKMPRTSWTHLRTLPIPLPPLPQQRAIAAVLDGIDDAIEGVEAVIAATERLRDALLHDLLTRGVPGWHTSWRHAPGVGTIPADWEVARLGDVAEVNRSSWEPTEGSPILYLDLTAVVAPGTLTSPKELAAADAPSRARRRVVSGDILVSTVRPNLRGFARVGEVPDNLVASTGFAVLSPKSHVYGSLVYHHVMTSQFAEYLGSATTGQAYPAVRPGDVINFRLPLPPLDEQRAIAAVLDGVDATIERAREERDGLQSLKASAADALLTGRVRVGGK